MNAVYTPQIQDRKKESLQTQYEFLNLLQRRHLHWMETADDPDIKLLHLDIADLIRKTTNQYCVLLDAIEEES